MSLFKKIVAGISAAAMLTGMMAMLPATAAGTCQIDTTETHQYIRGFGGIDMQEWQGYKLSDAELKTVFGNGDGQLGLTVLRVYVNPDSNKWNLAVPVAKYASQNGATVFATPWEPPSGYCESGGNNGKLHLKKENYGKYAEHLNNFGNYMKQQGVDLYSISVQNEPDYAHDWTYWSPDETTDFIANYGDKITSTRLMSPETFQYGAWGNGRDFYNKILNNAKAMANTDLFGTHFYGTPREKMDFPALENCGKEIWMTEVYVPNSDANSANIYSQAMEVPQNIHNAMVVGNMSAYTWWYIKRSYSLIEQNGSNGAVTKRGAMMAMYSKWVRPGAYRIDCTESPDSNLLISAYKNEDNTVAVVAINKGSNAITQNFNLESGEKIESIDAYRTDANQNFKAVSSPSANGTSFSYQLPASSVTTFVLNTEGSGSSEPQLDEDGYYFHDRFEGSDDGWTKRGGETVAAASGTAYDGNGSLLISDRTKSWNGAAKVLPKKAFKAGNSYSFSANAYYKDGDKAEETFCQAESAFFR